MYLILHQETEVKTFKIKYKKIEAMHDWAGRFGLPSTRKQVGTENYKIIKWSIIYSKKLVFNPI
jgi:hypothetical protein